MKRYVSGILIAILIASFAFLSGCGQLSSSLEDPSKSLSSATDGYPAVVEVLAPGGNGLCTGTIVGPKAVLTAAHCTLKSGTYTVLSFFEEGAHSATTTIKESYGAGVVNDPNDIALLIFDSAIAVQGSGNIYGLASSVSPSQSLDLVGFGCNNLDTRGGAGIKRKGSNQVQSVDDYLIFLTPINFAGSVLSSNQRILGPSNRAASCFGDSGGPALTAVGSTYEIVGVTHAGGSTSTDYVSQYVDLTRTDNRSFLSTMNSKYTLAISGL